MPKPVRKMQKNNAFAQAAVLPKIPPELLDQLVKGPMTAAVARRSPRCTSRKRLTHSIQDTPGNLPFDLSEYYARETDEAALAYKT